MIIAILGNPGCGKTLFLTSLAYWAYQSGYEVYSKGEIDEEMVPHQKIESLDDFANIESDKPIFIAYDEFWMDFDARRSGSGRNVKLSSSMLQYRKKNPKKIIFAFTAQLEKTIDLRGTNITETYMYPEIHKTVKINGEDIPVTLKIKRKHKGKRMPTKIFPVYGIHELYDTGEKLARLEEVNVTKVAENYIEPADALTKKELVALIKAKESYRLTRKNIVALLCFPVKSNNLSTKGMFSKYSINGSSSPRSTPPMKSYPISVYVLSPTTAFFKLSLPGSLPIERGNK
ncbi:hypothetical protein AKJ59_00690 [candidate division MSBL1 archaeon SCGC-AAA385M02]|uniref:Novel STAND NTPase 3 domain-containing protein n=1 Tax=candidate division MSBL1 archaeon SCGC-AAA385M02 TaxID=1698287 RepID=A0A133VQB7_9EURY|nr:hypothetical protein AKJ59_00690 [candidate division MSBL1 archaeon SCGC-AAA385M02]